MNPLKGDCKRGFQLGLILIGGGHTDEGIKIMNAAIEHFPLGNTGQDGTKAAEASTVILSGLQKTGNSNYLNQQ